MALPRLLTRLDSLELLCRSIDWQGTRLLTARPLLPARPGPSPAPAGRYRLSPLAFLRHCDGEVLLESPTSWAAVVIHERRLLPSFHDLCSPRGISADELAQRTPELPPETLAATLLLLHHCELLDPSPPAQQSATSSAMWAFHDRLLHARTRMQSRRAPLGKTYPFRGSQPPAPALVPLGVAPSIDLPQPDLARIALSDPPFSAVVEARRSIRDQGEKPIPLEALGEILFRTVRVRAICPIDRDRGYETSERPYPSAGACYPLEVYLAVNRCQGLDSGLYQYVPNGHSLAQRSGPSRGLERLLGDAAHAAAQSVLPQVLVILSARYARTAWAYGPLAYSLILKEAGGLLFALQLSATAMGLACCPLGVSDAPTLAQLAGVDDFACASVGELILGSAPELRSLP